jgi:hypothetical protein
MPYVIAKAKEIKPQTAQATYRNMRVTRAEVTGSKISFDVQAEWQASGPMM